MKTFTQITLINGVYHVLVGLTDDTDALTEAERQAFDRFGDEVVDLGGTFTGSPAQTFPTEEKNFPSQFPATKTFSIADNADANARAVLWRDQMLVRITTARDAALAYTPGTLGKDITEL